MREIERECKRERERERMIKASNVMNVNKLYIVHHVNT